MHEFLAYALTKKADHRITAAEVEQFAAGLYNHDFYNAITMEIAASYHRGKLSFTFCDSVMNDLWRLVNDGFMEGVVNSVPEPFYEIYLAFDAGEYHRKEDRSDDPVSEHTDPQIASLVTRLAL